MLAWYCGFGSAAVSVFLSLIPAWYYVLRDTVSLSGRSEMATIIGFAATTLAVSFLIDSQPKTLVRAKSAENAQAAIASENAHLLQQSHAVQERLQEANEDLKRANGDLELFAYSASHDLQEPVRNITLLAQRLEGTEGLRNPDTELLSHIIKPLSA